MVFKFFCCVFDCNLNNTKIVLKEMDRKCFIFVEKVEDSLSVSSFFPVAG
jgi:hypothetical protein